MYIVIVGCGRVGSELAKLLSTEGHDVVVVDKKEGSFTRLGDAFNGVTIKGSGVSTKTLRDAGIGKAEVFCAFTNSDNVNIMASQVAKGIFKVSRVIARVYDPQKARLYKTFGLEILSEPTFFASMIRDKIVDARFSSYIIETNELGVLEVPAQESMIGKSVGQINIPGELIVTAIRKTDQPPVIPSLETMITADDTLVAVVKVGSLKKINKELNL